MSQPSRLYSTVRSYTEARAAEYPQIPDDRKPQLRAMADYVLNCLASRGTVKLVFICTHNSRRSQLSQVWACVAADFYSISGIETYSGGTEATAFNPRAVAALERCGLKISTLNPADLNPIYEVRASDDLPAQRCFSKVFNSPPNPTEGYAAIMTCAQADEACPLVQGCDLRMPIRYEDPKVADGTPQEAIRYDERSAQICREMLFVMSLVAANREFRELKK